jgi:hypothetical protein
VKALIRLFILALLGCLTLATCSPNTPTPPTDASGKQIVGSEGDLYPPQDLSLIGRTAHPQFLNSYADW